MAAAIDTANRTGGEVPAAEMEAIERFARLLQLQKNASEGSPRRSWEIAAIGVTTLCVVSVLLFARVPRTTIDLDVDVTQLSFSIDTEQILFQNLELVGLQVSGLSSIRLPEQITTALSGSEFSQEPELSLSSSVVAGRQGVISIVEIKPVKQTAVEIRQIEPDGRWKLSLQNPGTAIDVSVLGPVTVSIADKSQLIDFPVPQGLTLEPARGNVDFTLAVKDPERAAMTPQVPVSTLEFWRVEESGDRGVSVIRTLSTVLGGTIYLEELGGASRSLRSGEILRLPKVEEGELRTLRMRSDRLSIGFHGLVRDMSTGSAGRIRSLMPTWLDWLKAQHGLSLLWGTTIYIAGLGMAVLRWFKGSV